VWCPVTPLNIIAVAGYAVFSLYLIRQYKRHFIFFGFLFFSQLWALVSCLYNDLGIYNIELFRFTFPTHATSRLALLYIIFNLGFLAAAILLGKRPLARIDYSFSRETLNLGNLKLAVYAVLGLMFVYLVYVFAIAGIPVLSGTGRFEFFQAADPVERALIIYGGFFAFALGLFRYKTGRISANGVILIFYLIFALVIGNKFSMLVTIVSYYYAPIFARYYAAHPDLRLFRTRYAVATAIIILGIGVFAFATYTVFIGNTDIAKNYLLNRVLAFQGEIWWAVDHDVATDGMYDRDHAATEWKSVMDPGSVELSDVGMKYVMVKILGPEKAFPIFERGYLYTMAYPAILITMYSFAATAAIQFAAGIIFFLILYYLYYSIVYRHHFRAIVTMMILMPYITVLFTGNLGVFFTFGLIIKVLILLALELGGFPKRREAPV
jgi:hypothetical protein